MNNETKQIINDPKNILSMLQIGALLATIVWVFAVLSVKVDRNSFDIQIQHERVESTNARISQIEIRQAVNREQYRQIIEQLESINKKLDR